MHVHVSYYVGGKVEFGGCAQTDERKLKQTKKQQFHFHFQFGDLLEI